MSFLKQVSSKGRAHLNIEFNGKARHLTVAVLVDKPTACSATLEAVHYTYVGKLSKTLTKQLSSTLQLQHNP